MGGFDHFDHLASIYDRASPYASIDLLLRFGQFKGNETVLDAGGGTGRVASSLSPRVRKIIVADLSVGMVNKAVKKGLNGVLSPVEKLPFPNGMFDRVIMFDALHHVIDQVSAAREMWRVLAPGGIVVIQEPDIRKFPVKLIALAEKIALMRSHFLSADEIVGLFAKLDFSESIVCKDYSAWVMLKRNP